MNYERDLQISEYDLDVEWLNQASLFMKYAKNAADCRKYLDQKKESLELTKAELDRKIRSNPEKFKIEKITEATITATIISHDDYRASISEFNEAKYELDIAQAAVSAMNQKKEALENLVKLHGQKWFAGPQMPRDLRDEREKFEQTQKEVDTGISRKLNNGRRTR